MESRSRQRQRPLITMKLSCFYFSVMTVLIATITVIATFEIRSVIRDTAKAAFDLGVMRGINLQEQYPETNFVVKVKIARERQWGKE